MGQLHKQFSDEQVKVLLANYCQSLLSSKAVQEYLGIGKTRFFALLKKYQEDPEGFTLSFSEDGIHWEPYPNNPVITNGDFPISPGNTWDTNFFYVDGTYYYFMEIGTLGGTAIYLATYEGPLAP